MIYRPCIFSRVGSLLAAAITSTRLDDLNMNSKEEITIYFQIFVNNQS